MTSHKSDPITGAPVAEIDAELADLVPRYLNNRWSDLALGKSLLAEHDFEQIAKLAHRIHGSARSYGFDGLGEIATRLQQAAFATDGQSVAQLLSLYDQYLRNVRIRYL